MARSNDALEFSLKNIARCGNAFHAGCPGVPVFGTRVLGLSFPGLSPASWPIRFRLTICNSCAIIILCLGRRFLLSLPASAHPKIPLSPLVATLTGTSQKSAKSDLVTPLLSILLLHSFSLFFTHVTLSQSPPSIVAVETLPLPAHLICSHQSRYNQSFEQEGNTCHD